MSFNTRHPLAPSASTGNTTHASVKLGDSYDAIAILFSVDVVGATPTVTWKIQGSADADSLSDANSAWFDLGYITDASDTISVATRAATALGKQISFLSNPLARRYNKFRLVTSANTNVTYSAEIIAL